MFWGSSQMIRHQSAKLIMCRFKSCLPLYDKKNVIYPIFELCGPPCINGCDGVLVMCMSLKPPHESFKKCSKCGKEFKHQQTSEIK